MKESSKANMCEKVRDRKAMSIHLRKISEALV